MHASPRLRRASALSFYLGSYLVFCLCLCATATAGDFGGALAATTDYIYRGLSQTRGKAALQADVHYRTVDAWTFGAWGTTLGESHRAGPTWELDLYLNRLWTVNPDWDLQVGLTHYMYPDDPRPVSYEYDELTASLIYQSRLAATIAWSPNVSRYHEGRLALEQTAISYELSAMQPLIHQLSGTAGAGYYDLSALAPMLRQPDGYWFWNAGLAWSMAGAQVAVAYMDTSAAAVRSFGSERAGGSRT